MSQKAQSHRVPAGRLDIRLGQRFLDPLGEHNINQYSTSGPEYDSHHERTIN